MCASERFCRRSIIHSIKIRCACYMHAIHRNHRHRPRNALSYCCCYYFFFLFFGDFCSWHAYEFWWESAQQMAQYPFAIMNDEPAKMRKFWVKYPHHMYVISTNRKEIYIRFFMNRICAVCARCAPWFGFSCFQQWSILPCNFAYSQCIRSHGTAVYNQLYGVRHVDLP